MTRFRILALLLLLLTVWPLSAQEERRGRHKYELPERPQSSRMPMESNVQRLIIPDVLKPVYRTAADKEPDAWLGKSLPELIALFPGLRMVRSNHERITYQSEEGIFFELYNNHVVSTFADVKGEWHFPHEEWYNRVLDRADESGYERLADDYTRLRYFYKTFVFTIDYDENTNLYHVRYDYLISQPRFGELSPVR